MIEEGGSLRTLHPKFAHVANVKKPHCFAHRAVFIKNATVLNRHIPAAKVHKAGAVGIMERV